ncbi:MAG TPA: haloacid dehalogenase type II [Candidatus Acidoferrum sp.]|nr:haloacid dehalogenase type II [Candidatus Acidoferrum sp.]HMD48011.1 haloacid dehalogenase type II [Bryobacteraceae bacterium]
MTPPLRALVFDAYGTLFDPLSVQAHADELFPGQGAALSQLWRAKQLEYSWLRTLMGHYENFWKITEDALAHSCQALQLSCDDHQRQQLMQVYLSLPAYPEVKPALQQLTHLQPSILSNGTPDMLAAVVAANGMARFFQHIFSVDSLQLYKPRPEVYQHAVDRLGLPKETIGFVSSNYWDIAGATSFGFRTYWLNRRNAIPDELGVTPTAILPNLSALSALLIHS